LKLYPAVVCLALVFFVAGCTRAIMQVAGLDPDTIELIPPPVVSTIAYNKFIVHFPTFAEPLVKSAVMVIPTYEKTEQWIRSAEWAERVAVDYQTSVNDALGSNRSITEIRSLMFPSLTKNLNLFHAHGLKKAIIHKRMIADIVIERADDPRDWLNSKETALIIDLSSKNQVLYHVVSKGHVESVDGASLFPKHGEISDVEIYVDWVASILTKFEKAKPSPDNALPNPSSPIGDRLKRLKDLYDRKLITNQEYQMKKQTLIDQL